VPFTLWLLAADGSSRRLLVPGTNGALEFPQWSSDGSVILVVLRSGSQWSSPGSLLLALLRLAEARARWTDNLGRVSDHEGQFGERVGKPGGRRHVGPEIVEAPPEVLDEGVRRDDDPGGAVAL
jgi:hypothetical protein